MKCLKMYLSQLSVYITFIPQHCSTLDSDGSKAFQGCADVSRYYSITGHICLSAVPNQCEKNPNMNNNGKELSTRRFHDNVKTIFSKKYIRISGEQVNEDIYNIIDEINFYHTIVVKCGRSGINHNNLQLLLKIQYITTPVLHYFPIVGHPGMVYSYSMYFTLQHADVGAVDVGSGMCRVGFQVRVQLMTGTYSRAGEAVDPGTIAFQVTQITAEEAFGCGQLMTRITHTRIHTL